MFLSGGKTKAKKIVIKKRKRAKKTKKSGGFATHMQQDGVHYSCEKLDSHHNSPSSISSGGDSVSTTASSPTTTSSSTTPAIQGEQSGGGLKEQKKLFKQLLNKMTKDSLMKKCRKYNIKVTTKKNGVIKAVKKETLVNKIVAAKFKK